MNIVTRFACLALVFLTAGIAQADDHESLSRELSKINAMSTDPNGRRVVSRLISTSFKVPHAEVLAVRRQLNLNYGSTFLFFQMASSGVDGRTVMAGLRGGKTLFQVGDGQQLKWKKIAGKAKEFNGKVTDRLYDYFVHETEIRAQDTAENYLPILDQVPADNDGFTEDDVRQAAELFQRQRLRASALDPENRTIDRMNENQVRHSHDQVRDGFPVRF